MTREKPPHNDKDDKQITYSDEKASRPSIQLLRATAALSTADLQEHMDAFQIKVSSTPHLKP